MEQQPSATLASGRPRLRLLWGLPLARPARSGPPAARRRAGSLPFRFAALSLFVTWTIEKLRRERDGGPRLAAKVLTFAARLVGSSKPSARSHSSALIAQPHRAPERGRPGSP